MGVGWLTGVLSRRIQGCSGVQTTSQSDYGGADSRLIDLGRHPKFNRQMESGYFLSRRGSAEHSQVGVTHFLKIRVVMLTG